MICCDVGDLVSFKNGLGGRDVGVIIATRDPGPNAISYEPGCSLTDNMNPMLGDMNYIIWARDGAHSAGGPQVRYMRLAVSSADQWGLEVVYHMRDCI